MLLYARKLDLLEARENKKNVSYKHIPTIQNKMKDN